MGERKHEHLSDADDRVSIVTEMSVVVKTRSNLLRKKRRNKDALKTILIALVDLQFLNHDDYMEKTIFVYFVYLMQTTSNFIGVRIFPK